MPQAGAPLALRLVSFATIDSTNEEARRMAGAGAEPGAVVVAVSQTKGRGRRGRHWVSPPGNLHCSVLLRPDCAAKDAANLSFVAAVALADAVAELAGPGVRVAVKWPNDVLLDGRKLAGILLESESAHGRIAWVAVGVGVNVAHFPPDAEVEFPATSLKAAGCGALRPAVVLDAFLDRFRRWYDRWEAEGFAPVRDEWLARAARLGETVSARLADRTVAGRFTGLAADGALLLDVAGEGEMRITAGDVFFGE
jgi:BirA family biotin operon repressor/biotin-[acetyl-CoA-carboxylase] ligase